MKKCNQMSIHQNGQLVTELLAMPCSIAEQANMPHVLPNLQFSIDIDRNHFVENIAVPVECVTRFPELDYEYKFYASRTTQLGQDHGLATCDLLFIPINLKETRSSSMEIEFMHGAEVLSKVSIPIKLT